MSFEDIDYFNGYTNCVIYHIFENVYLKSPDRREELATYTITLNSDNMVAKVMYILASKPESRQFASMLMGAKLSDTDKLRLSNMLSFWSSYLVMDITEED